MAVVFAAAVSTNSDVTVGGGEVRPRLFSFGAKTSKWACCLRGCLPFAPCGLLFCQSDAREENPTVS